MFWQRPMAAGFAVLNGAGELTGSIAMAEWGMLETPIVLTATNAVGRGYDAVVDALFEAAACRGRRRGGSCPRGRRVRRLVARRHPAPLRDHGRRPGGDPRRPQRGPSPRASSAPARGWSRWATRPASGRRRETARARHGRCARARQLRRRSTSAHRRGPRRSHAGGGASAAAERSRAEAGTASASSPRTSRLTPGSSSGSPAGSVSASPGRQHRWS